MFWPSGQSKSISSSTTQGDFMWEEPVHLLPELIVHVITWCPFPQDRKTQLQIPNKSMVTNKKAFSLLSLY